MSISGGNTTQKAGALFLEVYGQHPAGAGFLNVKYSAGNTLRAL